MDARNRIVAVLKPMLDRARRHPVLCLLVGLLVGLLAVFGAVMASGDPEWAYGLFGAGEKFRVLEFLGVAMGGVLLAIGAVIAHKRAAALERAAEAQAGAAQAQAAANKGAEDGRRQERLKNAIEHLGHASDSVRLGGVYELFHLAKDTEDLRQTVLDILCAYVRRTTGEAKYRKEYGAKPSEEIQSLLTLLFVLEYATFEGCRVDLQGSWLNGAVLHQAHLRVADLSRTHLQGAKLHEAHLQGVDLFGAHLQGADLFRTYLQGADLSRTHLQGAEFFGTHLQGAKLSAAHLQGAYFHEAHLQGAELSAARLQGTTCGIFDFESSFATRIRQRIDRESDLSKVIFAGGLSREDVDFLVEDMRVEEAKPLQWTLKPHIGKPACHELPEGTKAEIGAYTEEEAERWIAEYEEAMRGVPKAERG